MFKINKKDHFDLSLFLSQRAINLEKRIKNQEVKISIK